MDLCGFGCFLSANLLLPLFCFHMFKPSVSNARKVPPLPGRRRHLKEKKGRVRLSEAALAIAAVCRSRSVQGLLYGRV